MGSFNSNWGDIASIIQANQQVHQEPGTRQLVTLGVDIGSTFNGTLAESESSGSDSIHLTVDLNTPYVLDDGNSEVYGPVGFDVNNMIHNQHWVGGRKRSGRKRKAPEGTTGGLSMSGTSRTVSDFLSNVRNTGHTVSDIVNIINTSPIISESSPEDLLSIYLSGISAGNTQEYSPNQSTMISPLSSFLSQDVMDLLNGTPATVQPFIQSDSSFRLHPLSPQHWMTDSSFMETSSVSHIPRADNAGSSFQIHSLWNAPTASSFQSTHFPGASRIGLLESITSLTNFLNDISFAFDPAPLPVVIGETVPAGNEEILVPAPSSGPVVDLTTSGVGDSGRTANFLRHFMNNEIDLAPLPIVIGETVAAGNEEMLVLAGDGVMEPGQRDNPIVIEDNEEVEREEDQPAVNHNGNLSYEELLGLQEHVGHVDTGLSKRVIHALLPRHRYYAGMNDESCCICLDTYNERSSLGRLGCGHDFHYRCIWKWLRSKNFCPLCKRTALRSDRFGI